MTELLYDTFRVFVEYNLLLCPEKVIYLHIYIDFILVLTALMTLTTIRAEFTIQRYDNYKVLRVYVSDKVSLERLENLR